MECCDGCGTAASDVVKVVRGPSLSLCEVCIAWFRDMLREERRVEDERSQDS